MLCRKCCCTYAILSLIWAGRLFWQATHTRPVERRLLTSACHVGVLGWSMHQRWQDPWIEGEDADPFLALLAMLAIGAIAAGIALLLIH